MLTLPSFLSPLETAVITAILKGNEFGEILATQLAQSRLESRKHNGYGFYTTFSIPKAAPSSSLTNERLHANALVGGELCGFILWIRDGKAHFLEGYPLGGDAWPINEHFEQLKLSSEN
jgi:hypothetical protein